jgi:D-tagatose-1,6-bisphosphate aldolase subunit GatZ/KbaZ
MTTLPDPSPKQSFDLRNLIRRNRQGERVGTYAVCSAHPHVIDAAIAQSLADGSILHIESTSSQVNHLGGYTGQTPAQFADFVHSAAHRGGLPTGRILLGGDHLGPFPWRNEPATVALKHAGKLVRACVRAGYQKIHLDASMACADDDVVLHESIIADRAAWLCKEAESEHAEMPPGSLPPVYVIGSEVPAPGGESQEGAPPAVTSVDHVRQTLELFQKAFATHGVSSAWERVIGLVVQPGVEFGETAIFEYDRRAAEALSSGLPAHPQMAYEAHSTDYQSASGLAQMVEDHFAILKVGPWLTFAFREAIFALTAIEHELLMRKRNVVLSQVREALDGAMRRNPVYWRSYYHGDEAQMALSRAYSYSDRCRYYWHESEVQKEMAQLFANLSIQPLPLTLIGQYLPSQYAAIRAGTIQPQSEPMIHHQIRNVLEFYAAACRSRNSIERARA